MTLSRIPGNRRQGICQRYLHGQKGGARICHARISYFRGDITSLELSKTWTSSLVNGKQTEMETDYYLSVAPNPYEKTIANLGAAHMVNEDRGWRRVVIAVAMAMIWLGSPTEPAVHHVLAESQAYRIDHYLGNETVQNLLVFRSANSPTSRWEPQLYRPRANHGGGDG